MNQRETLKVEPAFLPRSYVKPEMFNEYPGPSMVISTIEVEGPLPETWPTESYLRVMGDADPKRGTLDDGRIAEAIGVHSAFSL